MKDSTIVNGLFVIIGAGLMWLGLPDGLILPYLGGGMLGGGIVGMFVTDY